MDIPCGLGWTSLIMQFCNRNGRGFGKQMAGHPTEAVQQSYGRWNRNPAEPYLLSTSFFGRMLEEINWENYGIQVASWKIYGYLTVYCTSYEIRANICFNSTYSINYVLDLTWHEWITGLKYLVPKDNLLDTSATGDIFKEIRQT